MDKLEIYSKYFCISLLQFGWAIRSQSSANANVFVSMQTQAALNPFEIVECDSSQVVN